MSFKTTNGLMRHLRNSGVYISGSKQKRQLQNAGYFHGYKGYRFFYDSHNKIPFSKYTEVQATIQYDADIKSLFYGKMMYIETAIKNISLDSILFNVGSESIQAMYENAINSYNNAPPNTTIERKRKFQQSKLNLENTIQSYLAKAYEHNNPKITHFYNNFGYSGVPLWALFEILMMGDFGFLLSCLTYEVRDDISKRIGLNLSVDTSRQLVYKYIFTLKDLRNAIAHNSVVFDARFRNIDPTRAMKQCLIQEIGVPYINFKTIGDYMILMCYFLNKLGVTKTEIKTFIRDFERSTTHYKSKVSSSVYSIVVHSDLFERMDVLKNYL